MTTPSNDEKKFNETLKRMLKTPPTPHAAAQRQTVVMTLDTTEFESTLAKATELSLEVLGDFIDALEAGEEIARFDLDSSPALAGKLTVRLDPSDRLAGLVAAIRARD
jgi:hypothetical protein